MNLISSDHLKFVQYFLSNFSSFSNRSNWEEKRFIFTRLSLQILAALRELINSQNIKQIENEIILNMIQARREIAKITIQLIFEIGPFKEVRRRFFRRVQISVPNLTPFNLNDFSIRRSYHFKE